MKKSFIILPATTIVLVIAYLAYHLLKPMLTSPCENIFQQTSVSLGSKLEVIKTKGEVFVGREKIQDLTERSQMTGLNLKTCCIVLETGKVSPKQFLSCKRAVEQYEKHIETVVTYTKEAQAAKQQGKTDLVNERVSQINAVLEVAETGSQQFHKQVTDLSAFRPERKVEKEESSKGGSEQEPNKAVTVEVPGVVNREQKEARGLLEKSGPKVGKVARPQRPEAPGYVTGESPLQGERPWYEQLGTLEPPAQPRQR
ncbi:MAG: hypothetical protein L0Z46_10280 [Nitrospiraceae bacterium]|nr:hypothetical protein [Nitrospiraceae bacterium]